MKLRGIAITAGALALGAAALVPLAIQATNATGNPVGVERETPRDLTGTWKLDAARSSTPRDGTRRPTLPALIRIDPSDVGILLSDSSGTIFRDISFQSVVKGDEAKEPPRVAGTWHEGRLIASFIGPRGAKYTETFTLDDNEKELVVRSRAKRKGGGEYESKRVYVKVRAS
jgi:hypothetical protein